MFAGLAAIHKVRRKALVWPSNNTNGGKHRHGRTTSETRTTADLPSPMNRQYNPTCQKFSKKKGEILSQTAINAVYPPHPFNGTSQTKKSSGGE